MELERFERGRFHWRGGVVAVGRGVDAVKAVAVAVTVGGGGSVKGACVVERRRGCWLGLFG